MVIMDSGLFPFSVSYLLETFGGNGNVHYLDCGDSFTGVCLCQNYQTVCFQCVHFFNCKLHLNKADKRLDIEKQNKDTLGLTIVWA